MERFCVFTVLLFFAITGTVVWIGVSMHNQNVAAFERTAVFEASAVGTQSGVRADVKGFAVNEDRTRCVLYIGFSDAGGVPMDANAYKVHVTGVNNALNAQRKYNMGIAGSFYLYGSTGDALIYMTCPSGFDDGAYKVFLEGTSLVTAADDQVASDVFEFSIHPGSSGAMVSPSLDGDSFDASAFYADVMLDQQEKSVKKSLDETLTLMDGYLNSIDEFSKRLAEEGIVVDNVLPDMMAKDVIGKDANGNLFLTSGKDYPKALNIDWRNSSVTDGGYAKDVKLGTMTLSEYLANYSSLETGETVDEFEHVWKFADGRDFETVHEGNASGKYDEIAKDIERYEMAVQSYLMAKKLYQVTYPLELLGLEEQAMTMADTVKVATDCVEPY